ncbi:unnamed protein product, partial [Chrysoparadoxa australica]
MQPFHCLQLELQWCETLEDALSAYFRSEVLAGVKGRHNGEIRASKTARLESLPQVLTIHLKQFYFDQHRGCPGKVGKRIRYPQRLDLPASFMSRAWEHSNNFSRDGARPPSYSLLAVVMHLGRSIHGGHYISVCS